MQGVQHRSRPSSVHIERKIQMSFTPQQSQALTALCRRYGLVDERGAARGVEIVRALIIIGLTPNTASRSTAMIAARINAKMLVASIGARLSRVLGASVGNAPTPMAIGKCLKVNLDGRMLDQMASYAPQYRDGHGKVESGRLGLGMLARGMADTRLDSVLREYAAMINPFRAKAIEYRDGTEHALSEMARGWAASAAA